MGNTTNCHKLKLAYDPSAECGDILFLLQRFRQIPDKERNGAGISLALQEAINPVLDGNSPWPLLVWGQVGTGKTCAGLVLCDYTGGTLRTAREMHRRSLDAGNGILQDSSGYAISRCGWIDEIANPELFVLDELGHIEKASGPEAETVQIVLDTREGKPLLLLSNRSPKELAMIYGDPVVSRMTSGTVFHFVSTDRRVDTRVVVK